MEKVTRKGIAFNRKQLEEFDSFIKRKGFKNRSDAIRKLITDALVEEKKLNPESRMTATLTMVYNHHNHDVQHNLTHIQHHHHGLIRSSLHVHMDNDNCLEVLILEGTVKDIRSLSDEMAAEKGVKHAKLILTDIC
ncbi:nickel-responsive transcriptional regulator NikR [Candidatus Woesearchaeota archaeon]|nr:nickel-responsive transcriptional regulator NikR [Candidatus Woesearchaeota archaeon]